VAALALVAVAVGLVLRRRAVVRRRAAPASCR
jgi:hypothetical protein